MIKILDSKFIPIILFVILILMNLDMYFNSGSITGLQREGFVLPGATIIAFIFAVKTLFKK
tara:strand:- start:471 stop:653 length:183 start_codon:yes stop_codon:yes gene_type:complete